MLECRKQWALCRKVMKALLKFLQSIRLFERLWHFSVCVFASVPLSFIHSLLFTFLSPIYPSPVRGSKPGSFLVNLPAFLHIISLFLLRAHYVQRFTSCVLMLADSACATYHNHALQIKVHSCSSSELLSPASFHASSRRTACFLSAWAFDGRSNAHWDAIACALEWQKSAS